MPESTLKFISIRQLSQRDNWSMPAIRRLLKTQDGVLSRLNKEGKEVETKIYLISRVKEFETNGKLTELNKKMSEKKA